ncbi:ABC transporter permease [Skermanella stibiiresistens SB22]|uniref:ABC transporter permease n=1 Tax=Skermanella stibiiresistens SB22 TaxID=1385369 RepID=W9GZS9_9PROT|nr:iron ABC transporter permease [Skermanella stibiiresistens]EWY39309.1 ABC transporter permease [Skermanella stibiiresistens SB22]
MAVQTVPETTGRWMPRPDAVLLVALASLIVVVSVLPMARLIFEALAPSGSGRVDVVTRVLSSAATWRAAGNSVWLSLGATALAVALGGGFALLAGLTDLRGKPALVFCFMLPLMIPPQITALSWIHLFGPSSALLGTLGLAPPPGTPNPLYSRGGIILLMGIEQSALVFLALRAGLRAIPRELVEAAQAAGAGRWRVLMTIVLPLAAPSLIAGTALAFVASVGNFGIPALLGIPAGISVLPTLIYQRLAGFGPAVLSDVAVLSILVGLIAFAGVLLQGWLLGLRDFRTVGAPARTLDYRLGRWRPAVEAACWLTIVIIVVVPLAALVTTSLVRVYGAPLDAATVTLANYAHVLLVHDATSRAFRNSLMLAGTAAAVLICVAVPLGYFIVWRRNRMLRVLNLLAELPYALPGVVLAIATILVFIRPVPFLNVTAYGTVWIILIAYLARFLSLALRPVVAGFHTLDPALEEAARMCGAGLIHRLRTVIVPMAAPVAAAGGILVFLTSFNELTVSILLWSSGAETLGVVVYSLEESGGTVLAAAVSVIAVAAILAIMLGASLLARRLPPGVLPWQA